MKNQEPQSRANTLASLATLYPEAFAMASAVNSGSGLAMRRWEFIRSQHACSGNGAPSQVVPPNLIAAIINLKLN